MSPIKAPLTYSLGRTKRMALVLLGAACISLLTGCHSILAGRAPVELVIWSSPTGIEEQGFLRICRRFEAEHPGIRVRNVGALGEDKLVRAIVAAVPPDLAYIYGTDEVGALADNGALYALDADFARAHFHETDFLPGVIAQGRYRGKLYAMPVTRDSHALYRNRARFREAGMDPDEPPKTLEEAITLAARMTRRGPDGTVEKLGMYPPEDPPEVFAYFGGGAWDPRTGRITANCPQNVAALRWLVALADAQGGYKAVAAFVAGFGRDSSEQNPLATGKIAMRIDGEWAAMYLEKYAPGTDYALSEIPYPAGHPELKNMAWQDGDTMMIPIGSHHPDLAWEFMRWMQQPTQQEEYAAAMNNLPSILALRNSPHLTQGSRSKRSLGYILRHIASDPHNPRFLAPLPITHLYRNVLRTAFDRALFHEQTPEQALDAVQTRIDREMRRYAP